MGPPAPGAGRTPPTSAAGAAGDLASVSRDHILRVLEATNWVIGGPSGAAARLGVNRTTLHFRMKKLGIVRDKKPSPVD